MMKRLVTNTAGACDEESPVLWLLGFVAIGMLATPALSAQGAAPDAVTFTKDIAPILQRSCQQCHSPSGLAPMPFTTYEEVRPWARSVKQQTSLRNMPPWFIEKDIGIQRFKDDISISDEEITTIAAWVDNGAPRGNPADMPPPLEFPPAGLWSSGEPDLVLSSPAFTVRAVGADWHGTLDEMAGREIKVPTGLTEDRWVKSVEMREIRPEEEAAHGKSKRAEDPFYFTVHHSSVKAVREGEDADLPAGGAEENLLSYLYEVGQNAMVWPDDVGVLVPANSVIVFPNNHIHSIGREVKAQIEVGLTFHPKGFTPKYTRGMGFIEITGDRQLDIPGNTDDVRYDFFFTLTENRRMVNFEPHLHSSGKRMCQEVIYPSGHREMLNCARYSHNWVKVYSYEEDAAPLLPKGTILHTMAWYNNSETNPLVADPRNWKGLGQRSTDDMFFLLSKFLRLTDEEFQAEVAAREAKERAGKRSDND